MNVGMAWRTSGADKDTFWGETLQSRKGEQEKTDRGFGILNRMIRKGLNKIVALKQGF